jgi:hypothetical protein
MLQKTRFLNRSVLQEGQTGVGVAIPAEVRDDLQLEAGKDGSKVDMEYNRDDRQLVVHLPEP